MPRPTLAVCFALGALSLATACKQQAPAPAAAPAPAPAAAQVAKPTPPAAPTGVQSRVEMWVTEKGFEPEKIPAKAGQPITLVITRKAERTCATEILFQGQEGKTELPLNKTVEVTYTPKASGKITFGCAMGMMIAGVLEVSP
jgi:plastocyanin domain-containing protein